MGAKQDTRASTRRKPDGPGALHRATSEPTCSEERHHLAVTGWIRQVKSSYYSPNSKEPNPQQAQQRHAQKEAVYKASGKCPSRF